jgi:hypothetical protein
MWDFHDEFCIEEVFRNKRKKGKDVPPGAERWLVDTHTGKVLGIEDMCYWLGYRDGVNWLLSDRGDDGTKPERLERLRAYYEAACPADETGEREWTLDGNHGGIAMAMEGLDLDTEQDLKDSDQKLVAMMRQVNPDCEHIPGHYLIAISRFFDYYGDEWADPDNPSCQDRGVQGFVEGIMKTYWRLRCWLGLHSISPPSNN